MVSATNLRPRSVLLGLVALAGLVLAGSASPVFARGGGRGGGGGGGKDFSICCDDSSIPGFLVRGGSDTCPAFDNCAPNPGFEPHYFSCGFSDCGYGNAVVSVSSVDGFSGTVALELLNLPPGVISRTAPSVSVVSNNGAITNFSLAATDTAVPGDYIVTVRGISGSLVHDASHLIRIRDALPPPILTPTFSPSSVQGGATLTGTVALAGPAPGGGAVVSLFNDNQSVATAPATVTIPAGQTSATFTVQTSPVTATSYVSINPNYESVIYPIAAGTFSVTP